MKKIRIGNDIRLAVDLRKQVLDGYETLAIRKVSAYLVNTTKVAEYEAMVNERPRFSGRFPREPFSHEYDTTPWCLCGCGTPTYNAYPVNACNVYSGFGTCPYDKRNKKLAKIAECIQYKAACAATEQQNVINVYFPAKHQVAAGVYKLVIVADVYEPGYNVENIRTVQADFPNVFQLVETSAEGIDTGIIILVDGQFPTTDEDIPSGDQGDNVDGDIYVNGGELSGNTLVLNRTNNIPVSIDIGDIAGWYEGD